MDWELILARMADFDADPVGVVRYLQDLRDRARKGIIQEKASAKDGIVAILEKYPQIELAATKEMVATYKYVQAMADKAKAGSGDMSITIEVKDIEFDPALTEQTFHDPELMPEE